MVAIGNVRTYWKPQWKLLRNVPSSLEWGIDLLAFRGINYLGSSALYFQVLMLQVAKLSGTAHTLSKWELSTAWAMESEVQRGRWWKALRESATFFSFFGKAFPCSHRFSSVQFSLSVMSDSLRPKDWSMPGFPVPSLTPRAYSNSCPSSQWCHPTILSSVATFSSFPQFSPESEFTMSRVFAAGGQSIGASASASVLPMNI